MSDHKPTWIEPDALRREAVGGSAAAAAMLLDRPAAHARAGAACCSIWSEGGPIVDGAPAARIGHFHADDEAGALLILNAACERLAGAGRRVVLGPMNGSTWKNYRLSIQPGDHAPRPAFAMEPLTPAPWPAWFERAGFTPDAMYYSSVVENDAPSELARVAAVDQLEAAGVIVSLLDLARFDQLLVELHALSLIAFAENHRYTPLSIDEFREMYAPLRARLTPELTLLARDAATGRCIGYCLAIPDLAQAARGERVSAVVLKTLAVHPDHRGRGVGGALLTLARSAAARMGMPDAVYALMHEHNRTFAMARRVGRVFRRYVLLRREIHV